MIKRDAGFEPETVHINLEPDQPTPVSNPATPFSHLYFFPRQATVSTKYKLAHTAPFY
jgi:hypothetical protein